MPVPRSSAARTIAVGAMMVAATVLAVDFIAYFVMPASIARVLPAYRRDVSAAREDAAWRRQNPAPEPYYVVHPERGFEIGPGRHSFHVVENTRFPVWSNALGCFDREWGEVPKGYIYFAGDSFTWGWVPFHNTFAALFERATGIPSLKCGVPHTGQAHQFAKFVEIAARIGFFPGRVVVAYCVNDFANDNAYPHSTVIDGALVDTVLIDAADRPVRLDARQVEERARRQRQERSSLDTQLLERRTPLDLLKTYSVTLNVLNGALHRLGLRNAAGGTTEVLGAPLGKDIVGKDIYDRPETNCVPGILPFAEEGIFEKNAIAIRRWKAHSNANGYRLTFLLIPSKFCHDNVEFYQKLRAFLDGLGIEYIDLSVEFKARRLTQDQLYWVSDRHFSVAGAGIVADTLVNKLLP